MKTVTIPTSQSQFVVMVNGAKYVYPAGSVQDVPDEVAVVIEAHNKQTAKPNNKVDAPFDCGGGVSSWNDLTDKPFGDANTVILEEQELQYDAEIQGYVATHTHPIHDGDALTIVYDGKSYECNAIFVAHMNAVAFGNLALVGFPTDTGEPFFGGYINGIVMIIPTDGASHTVKITAAVTTKIPTKYLPDSIGGVKYVTIGRDDDDNYTASATYAQITTWIKSGLDVKCIYDRHIVPLVFSDALSEITTYAIHPYHEFTAMHDIAQGLRIRIYDDDDITITWLENIE